MLHARRSLLLASLLLAFASDARAQSGTTDDRVSLPDGPGSMEGIGDNSEIDPNMGLLAYSVDIHQPEGFAGLTPGFGLSYTSGGGNGLLGVGWSMPAPSIERLTVFGLPSYDLDDEFEAGGDHLVLVAEGNPALYRARFEQGFDRYWWHDAGDGTGGWWRVETSDGNIHYYGADQEGSIVDEARLEDDGKTFRYHLVQSVDSYGHVVGYTYTTSTDGIPLVDTIGWIYGDDGAHHEYALSYASRPDVVVDCDPTFCTELDVLLSGIDVLVGGEVITSYDLSYDEAGGVSRLSGVTRRSPTEGVHPMQHTFEYTLAIGDDCDGFCATPYMVSMGNVGTGMRTLDATLLDINGDALPDLVESTRIGEPHRVYINRLYDDGSQSFDTPFESAWGAQDAFDFSRPSVQSMDADGDGLTDLVNALTGDVLYNRATGDWAEPVSVFGEADDGSPDFASDFSDGELQTIRFFDYDADKRIDIIRSSGAGAGNVTQLWANTPSGFDPVDGNDAIGIGFDSDTLEFADLNGDGLLDAMQKQTGGVWYRVYRGYGQWEEPRFLDLPEGPSLNATQAELADLEDLDGDGFDDLVLVEGSTITFWRNRNGASLEPAIVIDTDDVEGTLPTREGTTTVLFSDMNANGSIDILWVSSEGNAQFLDLFPVRPHLISRIDNGLGGITDITYGTAVQHMARDGGPEQWTHRLPMPMNVVDQMDQWDQHSDVHTVQVFDYHDGWFDGVERQLRGFESVEVTRLGDDFVEMAHTRLEYDLGDGAPEFAGLLIEQAVSGGDGLDPIRLNTWNYSRCPIEGIPTDVQPREVVYPCLLSEDEVFQERRPEDEWATVRTEYVYDGFGNVTLESQLGVVSIGGGGCGVCDRGQFEYGAPCGETCEGDEEFIDSTYYLPTEPGDSWLLGQVVEEKIYSHPDDPDWQGRRLYYDGDAFEGLPFGRATAGFVSKTEQRVAEGEWIAVARNRADEHGNIVEFLGPLGVEGGSGHRQTIEFDALGLNVIRQDLHLEDELGPYVLRNDVRYDPFWYQPTLTSDWAVVRDGEDPTPLNPASQLYDGFGRPSVSADAGDTLANPTRTYEYDMRAPSSRVVTRQRSDLASTELDLVEVTCIDGRGQAWQTRTQLADDLWYVTGTTVFTPGGQEAYQVYPYESDSGECVLDVPEGTTRLINRYDALDRQISAETTEVDGRVRRTRLEYVPLATWTWDAEDDTAGDAGPHADTPSVTRFDGQGRMTATGRVFSAGAPPEEYTFTWHTTGTLASVTDPLGNRRTQDYDAMGRIVSVDDPDRGTVTYEYDIAGNILRETDARGVTVRRAYDGGNRMVERWIDGDRDDTLVEWFYDVATQCPTAGCTFPGGRTVGVRYPGGSHWFGYNERGLGVWFAREILGAFFEFTSEYDNVGRAVAQGFPTGYTSRFTYDGAGRVTSVDGVVDALAYDSQGDVTSLTYANGVETSYTLNEAREMIGARTALPDGTSAHEVAISRDRIGNIVAVEDLRPDDAELRHDAAYTLDAFYRLVQADVAPTLDAVETVRFAYDETDNILSRTSSLPTTGALVGDYDYDGAQPHAVTSVGALQMAYDAAGYMTARGEDTLSWDGLGRLTRIERGGATVAEYAYSDSPDRLFAREQGSVAYFPAPAFEVRDGVATIKVELGQEHVADIESPDLATLVLTDLAAASEAGDGDTDGEITAGDAWLAFAADAGWVSLVTPEGASTSDDLLAGSAALSLIDRGERRSYMHHDHVDSVVAVTDEDGKVIEQTLRYPFGAPLETTTNAPVRRGFASEDTNPDTGFVYFGARYYDPAIGRFISADPFFDIIEPDHIDQIWEAFGSYSFGWNNPQTLTDDDGNFVFNPITAVLGASLSFVGEVWTRAKRGEPMNPFSWSGLKTWGKIAAWTVLGGVAGGLSQGASLASFGLRYGSELAGHYRNGTSQERQSLRTGVDRTIGVGSVLYSSTLAVVSFVTGDFVTGITSTASAIDSTVLAVSGRSIFDRVTGYAKPNAYDVYDQPTESDMGPDDVTMQVNPLGEGGDHIGVRSLEVGTSGLPRPRERSISNTGGPGDLQGSNVSSPTTGPPTRRDSRIDDLDL